MESNEEKIREALEGILSLYNIKLDENLEAEPAHGEDYAEIISKTQERLDELSVKAEEIFKKTGMSREELEIYASNPNNFTKEQWEALQKVKEACDAHKKQALSKLAPHVEQEVTRRAPRKKELHRFAKRKNWIPL